MDKLLIAILGFSFIFSGAGLTSAALLAILFSGAATLDHITLISLTSLLTYYFYGFFGILYVIAAALSLIACGAMYWFELSVDDMKQKANELRLQEQSGTSDSQNLSDIDKKLAVLNEYKTKGLGSLCQRSGLTPERITTIKNYYNTSAKRFDSFCGVAYGYICQFRETTESIAGLKIIYQLYDKILVYKKNLETIRSLHKMTRTMQSAMGGPMGGPAGGNQSYDSKSGDMINLDNVDSFNKKNAAPMESMEAMDQMFANMKPEDMDMMMQQMFGGDFAKLLGGMEGLGNGMNGVSNKPPKKKINKK